MFSTNIKEFEVLPEFKKSYLLKKRNFRTISSSPNLSNIYGRVIDKEINQHLGTSEEDRGSVTSAN